MPPATDDPMPTPGATPDETPTEDVTAPVTEDSTEKSSDDTPTPDGDSPTTPDPSPSEPATEPTETPVDDAPTEPEPAVEPALPVEPAVPVSGQVNNTTDTTAGNTAPDPTNVVQAASTNQSDEVLAHNLGGDESKAPARPVGTLVPQKTVAELEDEIDSGEFKDIVQFVKKHVEAKDANVQLMARVLRMEVPEIFTIMKEDLGMSLPQGA